MFFSLPYYEQESALLLEATIPLFIFRILFPLRRLQWVLCALLAFAKPLCHLFVREFPFRVHLAAKQNEPLAEFKHLFRTACQ